MTDAERAAAPRLRKITPAEHRVMPWKNGLGTTREIAIDPPGAALDGAGFRWRLSIADVGQSGPFSAFPGIDRTIMVISGNGMELTVAGQPPRRLDRRFELFQFSGDAATDCRLIDGPIQDFNLMINRTRLTSATEVRNLREGCEIPLMDQTCLAHVFAGGVEICLDDMKLSCDAGETGVADVWESTAILQVRPRPKANIALMLLRPAK
jgi:uncharacterized protein